MRVSFDHKEISKGFLNKKLFIEVLTTVQFSEEELAIIKSRKLKDFVVLKRDPDVIVADRFSNDKPYLDSLIDAGNFTLTIGKLMGGKPDGYTCASPVHAKNYEHELTVKLKELKDFILGSAVTSESKTIEI